MTENQLSEINLERRFPELLGSEPVRRVILGSLDTPEASIGLQAVASRVARVEEPGLPKIEVPVRDVIERRPLLRAISHSAGILADRFPLLAGIKSGFDKRVEESARRKVEQTADSVIDLVEALHQSENPQREFVQELAEAYSYLSHSAKTERPERVIENIIWQNGQFPRENYPLLYPFFRKLLERELEQSSPFPAYSARVGDAIKVTPEIQRGIYHFLKQEGVDVEPPSEKPKFSFNNFWDSLWRLIAEWFFKDKLKQVEEQVPQILSSVKKLLPENGPEFAHSIYDVAKGIVTAHQNGVSNKEILDMMASKQSILAP